MYRKYTPIVHYISPPVLYYDSKTEVWFDRKSMHELVSSNDLQMDEMMFINAKVGGSLLDFEEDIEFDDQFSWWARSKARGRIGEIPIGNNYNLSMMWETGTADVNK